MNWKRYERKWAWSNLRKCLGICMAELRTFGLQDEIRVLGSVEFVDAYLHFITLLHGAVLKCKLRHLNNYIFKAILPPPPLVFA
jgi:hypothetical protein